MASNQTKHTPDVSVMPVYNSAQYVGSAIDSVLLERDVDFELILVDDGSSDRSGEICDSYAASDSRVRVIHKPNGGMCQARNWGLAAAKGEYVTFCDNDDAVLPSFISDNITLARKYDADCVRFGVKYLRLSNTGAIEKSSTCCPCEMSFHDRGLAIARFVEAHYGIEGVWSGIYRLSSIRKHRMEFPESFRHGYEDILFNILFMLYSERYLYNPNVYYIWKQRVSHSASAEFSYNGLESVSKLMAFEREVFGQLGLYERHEAFFARRYASFMQSFLTMSYRSNPRCYASGRKLYTQCRDILAKYADLYERRFLSPASEAAILLLRERYSLLHAYIGLGVTAKDLYRKFKFP